MPQRALCALTALIFLLTQPAFALQDPETFRETLVAGNIDAIERELEELDQKVLAGELKPDDQRNYYRLFETTDPKVSDVLTLWLEERPLSVYGRTAMAWNHFHHSGIARGNRAARHTRPEAFEESRRRKLLMRELAFSVFEDRKDFVPASDAVIAVLRGLYPSETTLQALDIIMQETPNWGSLRRALYALGPRWGGSMSMMLQACEDYGPMLSDMEPLDDTDCKVHAIFVERRHAGRHISWAQEQLDKNGIERFASARMTDLLHLRPDRQKLLEYHRTHDWIDVSVDNRERLWGRYLEPQIDPSVLDFGKERDRLIELLKTDELYQIYQSEVAKQDEVDAKRLERDPLNPTLLRNAGKKLLLQRDLTHESEAYVQGYGMLLAAREFGRWEPDIWMDLSMFQRPESDINVVFSKIELAEEAARVSGYHPYYLDWFSSIADTTRSNLEVALTRGSNRYSVAQSDIAEFHNRALCSALKAGLLTEYVCESTHEKPWMCNPQGGPLYRLSQVRKEMKKPENSCPGIEDVPVEQLLR